MLGFNLITCFDIQGPWFLPRPLGVARKSRNISTQTDPISTVWSDIFRVFLLAMSDGDGKELPTEGVNPGQGRHPPARRFGESALPD